MNDTQNANSERHYLFLTAAIAVGLVGVYLRFAGDARPWSWASNVILIIGIVMALRGVFAILK